MAVQAARNRALVDSGLCVSVATKMEKCSFAASSAPPDGSSLRIWYDTDKFLPPEDMTTELLVEGDNISGHVDGKYGIARYDGDWWIEDGTELSNHVPRRWTYV